MNIKFLQRKCFKHFVTLLLFLGFFGVNSILAQEGKTVKGIITDSETNSPLPGVNILEKGTNNGTSTDFDGNYSITLKNTNATLVVSYIGFSSKEVLVNGKSKLNIVLSPDAESLDEIVVVGYGTVKKKDLTGTVSTVSAAAITEKNATNPLEAIQGNVAGVQISSATGRVGDGFNMTIRGTNSLSGGNPLFVVDGVFVDDISFLNPQDISRMDVLKDASSSAIYGSRGANGVVIVTTKNGSNAKSGFNVSLETSYGVKSTTRLPKMMGGEKWWKYHQSAYFATTNGGDASTTTADMLAGSVVGTANALLLERANKNQVFDWYDAVLNSGIQQNNYINISGRAENGLAYNLGLGMQKETGNIANESIDKYTLKLGVNHKINDKISAGSNITIAKTNEQFGSSVAMRDAFRLNPFLSPWAIDDNGNELIGELFPQPGKLTYPTNGNFAINKTSTFNPLLEIANTDDERRRWKILGNVYFEYKPIEWLSLKTTYSGGYTNSTRGKAWGALTNTGLSNKNLPSSELSTSENFNYTWDNQFNIKHDLNENHSFNLLGLQSIYSNTTESSFLSSREQPFNTGFNNIGSGNSSTFNLGSAFIKNTLSSYALRLNYAFKDRYLFTLSNRWDGSSLLSEGNKWESFPSAAFAWKINEENFLSNNNSISNLKARVSFGYTGNDNVQAYSTLNTLDQQLFYDFNGATANGWLASSLANKALTWEKTREINFGVDFGFLNNRISGSLDVYDRLSEGQIGRQSLPLELGVPSGSTFANFGSISNKGVEILLTTKNIQKENISWETTFTFTKNTNSLEEINGQSEVDDIGNNWFIGESLNSYYNFVFDGIWQPSEAAEAASFGQTPGQARVKDLNNDGKIDANNDRAILGNSDPSWSGSIISNLRVGDFDLSISAFTNQGVFAFSEFHQNFTDVRDRGRQKLDIADWYIPENAAGIPAQFSNSYPQPRNAGTYWRNDKVGYYRDASFIKIKNIAVGYTFNKDLLSKLKINGLRIYANVLNPFVITDYDGYDPEWATASFNVGRVSSATYQLGLSLKF
ncbi:SusC/RagA family TonB-linked outer membrane protein [Polaribacter haliotis]|uniref:SusC/RagA family TonB-linked outer membrane protein n=1 Tax=Polaribacter haliotis TaxID=1888915 RepID=A0A7L8AE55_9FLAO|nr:SusC/RagA family TonB-linked outer membrane protein [Polaribacter haliotis]QOD60214.1 SusC/RagA family TonB-linked outer membrane protein [Polaribacter haliotis]